MSRRHLREGGRRRRRGLGSLLTLALVLTMAVVGINYAPWAAANPFTPTVGLAGVNPIGGGADAGGETREEILAGQDAVYEISVSNADGGDQYNASVTALVPNGVSFVTADGLLGTPRVYESGDQLPDRTRDPETDVATVPDGFQLWVWENIADLPQGATVNPTFEVRPDAEVFPVGSGDLDIDVSAYTSNVPNLLPTFAGSSSVSREGGHTSEPGEGVENTSVQALRIHKSEPSDENELLRGVHNNHTTYTLRVQHTGEGSTSGVEVVDFLPAGLEYLGNGAIDNSEGEEYEESGPLADDKLTEEDGYGSPQSVETIEATAEQAEEFGLVAGDVYTMVTWTLPELANGEGQNWTEDPADGSAGEPGEYVIRYRAAVPLFENTMDWDGDTPPADGAQAANLNNNNGPSTRHGVGTAEHTDAQSMVNVATVTGTYAGAEVSDSDTEVVDAVDLHVIKRAGLDQFVQEAVGTYTLDLATSEYTSAQDVVITDVIGNGLCPVLPEQDREITFELVSGGDVAEADVDAWNAAVPGADCTYPASEGSGAALTGATLTGLLFNQDDGTFQITLTIAEIAADDDHQVTYTARGNASYASTEDRSGPTSSGDSVANYVQVEATTQAIDALEGIEGAKGAEAVWEDSEATVISAYTSITKSVLGRSAEYSGGDPSTAADGAWDDPEDTTFITGDDVWYRLTVDFPNTVDTRNPMVTDFLPQGVEFREDTDIIYSSSDVPVDFTASGSRLVWQFGEDRDGSGDLFISPETDVEIYVPATVVGLSASEEAVDMPQNLMKFQQENSDGDIYFLRDDASITLDHGATLVKGVAEVDGDVDRDARSQSDGDGSNFGSDRDGIEVVQGETVTYRLDITAPPFATSNFQVWDVLPAGIEDDVDLDAFSLTIGEDASDDFTAAVLDPEHDDYPDLVEDHNGRWLVVFDVDASIPENAEVTLTYDVTIPVGTLVSAELDNDAGIAAYDATTNTGDTVTYVPEGPFDPEIDGALTVTGEDAYDDSNVYLPPATLTKERVSTEIPDEDLGLTDPNNDDEIVQGEYVTFAYSVTLPANTSVENGALADDGVFAFDGDEVDYVLVDAEPAYPDGVDPEADGFAFVAETGTLNFPERWDVGDEDETFTVEITVRVADTDASNPDHTPNLPHGAELENTARFTHNPPAGGEEEWTDSATVDYIEPELEITKEADETTDLQIGSEVEYTITVSNADGHPIAYENTIIDTVPEGLEVQQPIPGGGVWDEGVRTITWDGIPQVPAADGDPIEFTYTAILGPDAAGSEAYDNTVEVTGHTLPSDLDDAETRRGDRTASDTETVTTIDAGIAKGVRVADTDDGFDGPTTVPVGETVEYQVVVTLEPLINYWDPVITDTLPEGVQIIDATIEGPVADSDTIDDEAWDYTTSDNVVTWTYPVEDQIASHDESRELVITYQALVTDGEGFTAADELDNTAAFSWNRVDDDEGSRTDGITDDAVVNLVHPVLEISKTVNDENIDAVEPGETFRYDLVVTNDVDTPAYNIVVTDDVPAGVVVDPDSISDGGVLEGADPDTGGGTITWDHDSEDADLLNGPLYHAESEEDPQQITLSYAATLAASEYLGSNEGLTEFINTTRVTEWESFDEGGRSYGPSDPATAEVTTAFPYLELNKEPTSGDIAYAGDPFSWTLTAENTGEGAAYLIELTDTLPTNWDYTSTTSISVAGTAQTGDLDPEVDGQDLTWTFEGTPVLAPGATIQIAFLATPTEDALEEAGVGGDVAHTNTLAARATDPTGAEENADGPYTDGPDEAEAFIHAADLELTKTAAEDGIVAGTTGTGWTITVVNDGPDTAVGPFTVTDTTGPLPDGVVVTGVSGEGWVAGAIERGDDGATEFELWRANPADTLASGDSFPDIEVNVQVDADVAPTEVQNDAEVFSEGTYDPDPSNNDDDDPLPITEQADLVIDKSVNTAEPNAGESITWQLDPRNDGPSVSRSSGDEPITITDVIPDGIDDVTVEPGANWTAAIEGGGDFPATAGDTIEFTFNGDAMPFGPAGTITLSGMIDASRPAGAELVNTAEIEPGLTPDPDPGEESNTSTVTTTPSTNTMLGIAKARVVEGDDGWETATEAPIAGEPVSYLVTVANLGPADAQNVTVVDDLPEYFTYVSYEGVEGAWERTGGGDSGEQDFALTDPTALAPGETASFVVTADLASGHTGLVENSAQADADNSTNQPEDEDSTSSTRDADLSIVKEHTGDAVAGGTLDYTLTVTNEGPSSSSGPIAVADVLPTGFSYLDGSATVDVAGGSAAQVEPEVDGQWLNWTIGDDGFALANGDTVVISLTTSIADDVPAQTGLINSALVDGPEDSNPTNNRDDDPTDVVTQADMTVIKTAEDGPWVAGTEVDYTFTVTNAGPSVADAVVTDVWPAGLTHVSIDGEGWDCDDATCEFTGHPVGTTTLTVTALIDQAVEPGDELINEAHLTWTDSRGSHEDQDPETIEVTALADLGLVKTAVDTDGNPVTEATAGEQARFRLDVTNHGPSLAAAPITVVDTLPEGLNYVGLADGTHWDATVDDENRQQVTFVLDDGETSLAAGAEAPELTLIVQVDAGLPATDDDNPALVNTASVTSETPEPENEEYPNEDDEPINVVQSADLAIAKSHEGTATIGEDMTFDVVVTNNGPSTATGVTVADTIPAGLDFVGIDGSDSGWSVAGDPVNNDDGTTTVEFILAAEIAVGDEAPPLLVTTSVGPDAYPEVTNVVVADGDQPDSNEENNEDEDLVTVDPDADLTIAKETLTDAPHAGRELTWQITPTNLGPAESVSTTANSITITDTLPTGIVDVTVNDGEDWTATANDGFPAQGGDTIALTYVGADAMPVGDTAPITLTGTIESSFTGEITNSARINPGATPDRDPGNNEDEVTDPVDDTTSLDVLKQTADPATGEATDEPVNVVPGEQVTYELTVTNTGTADARAITLVDELPEGLTFAAFENVAPAEWTTDAAAGAEEITLLLTGSLPAPGGEATVRITANVADDLALEADDITNVVTAGAENVPEDEWPTDEVTDPLDPSADLSITKSHTGAVVAGLPVQYTLLVENHGSSVSSGPITVTDVLPEGMSYVADSAQVTDPDEETTTAEPSVDEQQLTWTFDDVVIPVEGTFTVVFEALVAADVPATDVPDIPALVNTGEVDGPIDDNPENNEDEDPTTITELTDVSILKTVIGTGPFTAGTEVDFELTVNVAGPSIARDVVVSDVVPDGLSLVSIGADGDGWTWDQTAGIGTRDTLALGEHVIPVTALIDQAVPAGETLTNTGVIEWTDSDGPHRDDDPEDIDVITDGDLGIVKTALDADGDETSTAIAGTELRYALEVTNHGPSQAVALLQITDELPEGLTFTGIVGDEAEWTVTQDGQDLTFTHPRPLAAGDTAPALIIATEVDTDLDDGSELQNVAEVESVGTDEVPGTPDSNPDNNDDEATVTVERAVDLAVAKSHEGEARIGEELTFDLAVRNAGPSEATDVVVIDTLPAGLTYVSATGDGWEITADEVAEDGTTTITAALDGSLAAGTDAPGLQVTVLVDSEAYAEVTNVAEVSSTEPDENPEDNTSTDTVTVPPLADLGIVKTLDGDELTVGEAATYTLVVTNHGPTEHVGQIAISDALPTGLVATDVQGEAVECEIGNDGALVECLTEENLAVDDTLTVTITVDVQADAWTAQDPEATNVATVTGTSEDPEEENNTSTVTTTVIPDVQWELSKTRGDVDGDSVDWTITVSSVGLSDAVDGAVVVDRLPGELRFDGVTSEAGVQCEGGGGNLVECEVPGPIASGASVSFTVHTTLLTEEVDTVTNTAWLVDPETGETIPETEDSADYRPGGLSATGVAVGALVALAFLLLLSGAVITRRARAEA